MTKEVVLFYAVNRSGQGVVFTGKPCRNDHYGVWVGEISVGFRRAVMDFEAVGFATPRIGWNDEPVELNLTIGYGEE